MTSIIIGSKIIMEEELPSTNTYAISMMSAEKPPEGTIIRTGFQSAGRGQPGNRWESGRNKNLLFSIILYPDMITPAEQFIISMTVSLGVCDFVSRHVEDSLIKWPNDIYVKDDKIAGILIESSIIGEKVHYMVAGIGLNINQEQFHSNAPNPVSLKQITGIEYDLGKCLSDLSADLDTRYRTLREGKADDIKREYHSRLYRSGVWAQFTDADGPFTGMIGNVASDGRISIKKQQGGTVHYYFKEVEFTF